MNKKSWCILFMAVVIFVVLVFTTLAMAEVSHGYRMGMLTKYTESGWFVTTGEGELSMGKDGQPLVEEFKDNKGHVTKNYINPWRFSTKEVDNTISSLVGEYVCIEYEKELINFSIMADTPYRVKGISTVDTDMEFEENKIETVDTSTQKKVGTQVCRIVQASYHGVMVKTYELTIQRGGTGGQYVFISTDSKEVYDFAVKCLKAGKLVKVTYIDKGIFSSLTLSFTNTSKRIVGIELMKNKLD